MDKEKTIEENLKQKFATEEAKLKEEQAKLREEHAKKLLDE